MSKEKQIEEMACKKCLHYEMCLDNFRKAKEEGLWELTDEEEYFSHADECDFCAVGYRKQSEVEWETFPSIGTAYRCSICKEKTEIKTKFCPKCGAKMKGGAE